MSKSCNGDEGPGSISRPGDRGPAKRGLAHPEEEFEFARFCLLYWYSRDNDFMRELVALAEEHRDALGRIAECSPSSRIHTMADFCLGWGLLSYLESRPAVGTVSVALTRYRAALTGLARSWGLTALWCAPSLNTALMAALFARGPHERISLTTLTPYFLRDIEREGRPTHDSMIPLERLLLCTVPGTVPSTELLNFATETIYYDPRIDSWLEVLTRVREVMGKRRLPRPLLSQIEERRGQIEAEFAAAGCMPRPKGRRLGGEDKMMRYSHWTYLSRARRLTARQVLDEFEPPEDPDYVKPVEVIDRGIKHITRVLKFSLD